MQQQKRECVSCRKQLAPGEGREQIVYGRGSRFNRPTYFTCQPCLDKAERERNEDIDRLRRRP